MVIIRVAQSPTTSAQRVIACNAAFVYLWRMRPLTPVLPVPAARSRRRPPLAPEHGRSGERTYLLIRNAIIRSQLAPGAPASEELLARRFAVSRTPIREALGRLARERFLVAATGGRRVELRVSPVDPEEVPQLWRAIGALESAAITAVAVMPRDARASLADAMREVNEHLIEAAEDRPRDTERIFELQSAFHQTFMNRCANHHIAAAYDVLRAHVRRYEWIGCGPASDADYGPSTREHRTILAAIRIGDAERAATLLVDHWATSGKRARGVIRRLLIG